MDDSEAGNENVYTTQKETSIMAQLKTANMKKTLVSENVGMVRHLTALHNETLSRLNQINDEYKKLNFGPLDTPELKSLFHHTDIFVKDQAANMIGELPSFNGFKMKREAFLETIELPDTSSIKAKIGALKDYWQRNHSNAVLLDSFEMYEGDVRIIEEKFVAALDGHRIFATTEKEKETFTAMDNILKAYKALDAIVKKNIQGCSGLNNWEKEKYLKMSMEGNLEINSELYQTIVSHGK
jgi:hypothetical protein